MVQPFRNSLICSSNRLKSSPWKGEAFQFLKRELNLKKRFRASSLSLAGNLLAQELRDLSEGVDLAFHGVGGIHLVEGVLLEIDGIEKLRLEIAP